MVSIDNSVWVQHRDDVNYKVLPQEFGIFFVSKDEVDQTF
jgi:hypothetical protein